MPSCSLYYNYLAGEQLIQRKDDQPETVAERLRQYEHHTTPVLQYYKMAGLLHTFTGTSSDMIWPEVKNFITKLIPSISTTE